MAILSEAVFWPWPMHVLTDFIFPKTLVTKYNISSPEIFLTFTIVYYLLSHGHLKWWGLTENYLLSQTFSSFHLLSFCHLLSLPRLKPESQPITSLSSPHIQVITKLHHIYSLHIYSPFTTCAILVYNIKTWFHHYTSSISSFNFHWLSFYNAIRMTSLYF